MVSEKIVTRFEGSLGFWGVGGREKGKVERLEKGEGRNLIMSSRTNFMEGTVSLGFGFRATTLTSCLFTENVRPKRRFSLRQNRILLLSCNSNNLYTYTHTHTHTHSHTHIYIYIYIYICVCECVCNKHVNK